MKLRVFENLPLKLVSLGLAIMIWILVVGEKRSEVRLTVPLQFRNLPPQLEISQQSTVQLEVAVRGFSSVIKQLTPSDLDAHLDLTKVVEGPYSFALFPDDITAPVGVTVMQVNPSQVDLFIDATGQKQVPIKPVTRGTPAEGYTLGNVTTDPKMVNITGPKRLLNTITQIETETIAVDSNDQDITKKVKLKLPNGIRIEKEEEKSISLSVAIIPKMVDLFFENIPLIIEGEERQYTLSPPAVTALIHGPEMKLTVMSSGDIPAYIETGQLPEGSSRVHPVFKLPEGVDVKRYYPNTITITLTK